MSHSSSSSHLPHTYPPPTKIKAPHILYTPHKSLSKEQQLTRIQAKLPTFSSFTLDQTTYELTSKRAVIRKVLKYVPRLKVDKSCKKLPVQVRNMTGNCKHYLIQLNSQKQSPSIIKTIQKMTSKHLKTLELSGLGHFAVKKTDIKSFFNLIISRRQISNFRFEANFSLNIVPRALIQRTFASLHKLHTLAINVPSLSRGNKSQENKENNSLLELVVSSIQSLRNLYLKCCVTRNTCEDLIIVLDKLRKLEKVGLYMETPERLSPGFYALVTENLSKMKRLSALEVSIDSYTNQRFNNAFFLPFVNMQVLERLTIVLNKLSLNDNDMQALFRTIARLKRLKRLHFESNGRALTFSDEYYTTFHQALSQMAQLESLTYDVNHLHSRYFSDIFQKLPSFPYLKSLALNVTISEGELTNVYFLSEFLKNAQQLRSLSLKINDGDRNAYTYQVPSEVFNVLQEGFERTCSLEKFELNLGNIEDAALNKILAIVDSLDRLSCLKLNASFDDVSYQAFGRLCGYLQRNKGQFNRIQVVPRGYELSNAGLLEKVIKEINAGEL